MSASTAVSSHHLAGLSPLLPNTGGHQRQRLLDAPWLSRSDGRNSCNGALKPQRPWLEDETPASIEDRTPRAALLRRAPQSEQDPLAKWRTAGSSTAGWSLERCLNFRLTAEDPNAGTNSFRLRGPWRSPGWRSPGKFRSAAEPDQPGALRFPAGSGDGASRWTLRLLSFQLKTRDARNCSRLDPLWPRLNLDSRALERHPSRGVAPWLDPCIGEEQWLSGPVSVLSGTWSEPVLAQFSGPGRAALLEIEGPRRTVRRAQALGTISASCGLKWAEREPDDRARPARASLA